MISNILIVAGEPSGDALGGPLVREMLALRPEIEFWGYGGSAMRDAGVEILAGTEELAVMGFVEVVLHLPQMFRRLRDLEKRATQKRTSAAILIDYPGFNLRLAKRLSRSGIPVIYYVSPQVWAWNSGRIKGIKESVSKMIVILPFEERIYREAGIPVAFVGHPFIDSVKPKILPEEFRLEKNLSEPILLLLPGSRSQEVSRLLEPMIGAYRILAREIDGLNAIVVRSPNLPDEYYAAAEGVDGVSIEFGAIDAMFASTAAICCSGSATLQCACACLPHVITYKTDSITAAIYRSVIKTDFIGLSNIVAEHSVAPEILLEKATPENLAEAARPYLLDESVRSATKAELCDVRSKLGALGVAARAARVALDEIYSP